MNTILHSLQYALGIVTLLGGVIAIHEFGHFIFAKYCGARVDVFSIGFGPSLFKKKWGETEYCLSLIPLGGYVKIYGQDPEEVANDPQPQPSRSLAHKPLHQRIGVFVGGPLHNFLLAIVIFTLVVMLGLPKLPPLASRVVSGSAAFEAGLRSGDKILKVDGEGVANFEQVAEIIGKHPGQKISMSIERDGKSQDLTAQLSDEPSTTPYGEATKAGFLDGLDPLNRAPIASTTGQKNAWGLDNGDKILGIEGQAIYSWEDIEAYLEHGKIPSVLHLSIERDGKKLDTTTPDLSAILRKIPAGSNSFAYLEAFHLYNSELFIGQTMPGSPAEKAGLKKGDRMVAVNSKKVQSFDQLRANIQSVGEELTHANPNAKLDSAIRLTIERDGKLVDVAMGIQASRAKDHLGELITTYRIGIMPQTQLLEPKNMILERTLNPFAALSKGIEETWRQTVMTVIGIKKIAMGEVSLKAVGGPIMIGKIAGDAYTTRGWRDFLRIMAVISISLGVFNLIPVPMLDGGHVVLAVVEAVRGKPLSKRVTEVSLKVGFSLLMILIVFALYNDIMRVLPF